MKPVNNQEQVLQACQFGLNHFSDESTQISAASAEGIVSFKSLIRGILQGTLVVCAPDAPPAAKPVVEVPTSEAKEETKPAVAKKKRTKKAA